MKSIFILLSAILLLSCSMNEKTYEFDLQGHRGARGLMPENTIPAFLKALDLGVDTIELDLVVTADNRLLVSHEPWFSHLITTKPDGSPVSEDEEKSLNIYRMEFEETSQYDVGLRGNRNFPKQQPMEAVKPLFSDAVRAIEEYASERNLPKPAYNIETKSVPEQYGVMVPQPQEFASILHQELLELNREFELLNRVIVQSFDPQTLIEFKKLNDGVKLAMLVSDERPMQEYINRLGFTPDIWSPGYRLVTPQSITEAEEKGMQVIPWTVNTVDEIRQLLELGVHGIITDYPDSASVLRKGLN